MVMIGVASSSLIWRVFVVTIRSYRETQIKDMVNFDIWRHMEKNKQSSTDKARPIFLIIKLLGLALPSTPMTSGSTTVSTFIADFLKSNLSN